MKNSIHYFKLDQSTQSRHKQGFWREQDGNYYLLFKVDASINTNSLFALIEALNAIDVKKTITYRACLLTKDQLDQPHTGLPCISNNTKPGLEKLVAVELAQDFIFQYRTMQVYDLPSSLDFDELRGILITLQSCENYNSLAKPTSLISYV